MSLKRLYEQTARYFEKTYNPENDLPLGPQITYPEMELFLLVESLVKTVQEQQERIERLEQQPDSETLRAALARTRNKKLRELIKEEIRRRENLGKDYPLEIEDFLG